MAEIHSEIEVCQDCMIFIANDELPDDASPERHSEITEGVAALPGYPCSGDETDEFSRSACDCCGTSLAGSRHAVTIFCPPEPLPVPAASRNAFADEGR